MERPPAVALEVADKTAYWTLFKDAWAVAVVWMTPLFRLCAINVSS
jgi:hypothetical protein